MLFHNMKSVLIVPAIKPELFTKSKHSSANLVLIDFEDSIPKQQKNLARMSFLNSIKQCHNENNYNFRINCIHDIDGIEDILFLINNNISIGWLLVSKVLHGHELNIIRNIFKSNNIQPPKLMSLIESSEAVINIENIAENSDGLMFGSADYALDFELPVNAINIQNARYSLSIWANRFKIPAIDTPTFELKNDLLLSVECIDSRNLGFSGKLAISKSQVDIINSSYNYNDSEISWAEDVTKVNKSNGVISVVNNNMVGTPFYTIAKTILNDRINNA